jgi:LAS superfamily LD-carboxypeptidase LdcB
MATLSSQELTGRARTHVLEQPELDSTLHPEAARALLALRRRAAQVGIDLVAVSSFRDFNRQLAIWNDKFHGRRELLDRSGHALAVAALPAEQIVEAILYWSALPGASRHHWGTEIDVIDRAALPAGTRPQLVPSEYAVGGVFEHLTSWLDAHAEDSGFFRPYDRDRGGVQPEPWHLSYAPIAGTALAALTVGVLEQALEGVALAGAEVVLRRLPEIHARYVCAVAAPSAAALASRAARPS